MSGAPDPGQRPSPASLPSDADVVVQAPHVLPEEIEILRLLTSAAGIEPLVRAQCEAYRLDEPAHVDGVAEACAAAGYDFALVPRERLMPITKTYPLEGVLAAVRQWPLEPRRRVLIVDREVTPESNRCPVQNFAVHFPPLCCRFAASCGLAPWIPEAGQRVRRRVNFSRESGEVAVSRARRSC